MNLYDDMEEKKSTDVNLFEETAEHEPNMLAYSYHEESLQYQDRFIQPAKVSYGDATYRNFDMREVFIDSKPKGEYFIKIKSNDRHVIANACMFLSGRLTECDVGLIDPDNRLNLDFHIFIKTSDEFLKCSIHDAIGAIDDYITQKIRSTT